MDLLEGIYTRRSIRQYTGEPVAREHLIEIVKAGMWAPSGLNNQPWRFAIVRDAGVRRELGKLTRYHSFSKRHRPASPSLSIKRRCTTR